MINKLKIAVYSIVRSVFVVMCGVGILFLLGGSSIAPSIKEGNKKVSKAALNKAREKAVETVVSLLKKIQAVRSMLGRIETGLFDSVCNFFEDSDDDLIMSKNLEKIEHIERSASLLKEDLEKVLSEKIFSL